MKQTRSHFRWVIVALLFFITIINYIDRSSMGYAIHLIAHEFHLSDDQIGLILGAFGIGYVVTSFLGGVAADHFGARKTLAGSILFWSIATFLTALTHGFFVIFLARILLGLAEGPNFPGMTRAISDWLPENERNRALSFALVSVPLSLAIGGPITTQLILLFNWRGAYFILTACALLWLPLWWFCFRDKPEQSRYVNADELAYIQQKSTLENPLHHLKNPWKLLLTHPTLLANNWSFFVFGFYLFFFMTWLPQYLDTLYHLKLETIGLYTLFPWLFAALMIWLVGSLCDHLFKRTGNLRLSRTYPIIISQLLAAICIIPVIHAPSAEVALCYISLAIGFSMSANAAYYAVNIDIAKERAGTALGIMDALFAISGFLAPTLAGLIVTWTGHFAAVFWLLAGLGLSSVIINFIFHNTGL